MFRRPDYRYDVVLYIFGIVCYWKFIGSSKPIASYNRFTKLALKANNGTLSYLVNDVGVVSTSYGKVQIGIVKDLIF
ncbi:hypothetical protein [Chitinophaga sp. LS1]|uniref:hypothetical protein n=1 Tax=Chitinophaga sp. LS1 TaxID=3051176 RepID=UPI002AABB928|nr:hypothetical protein [Chitinophaga sp. LS1]WPV70305.1 hypothetical protein QQL36_16480 [Chitinophaga sp. LS1]